MRRSPKASWMHQAEPGVCGCRGPCKVQCFGTGGWGEVLMSEAVCVVVGGKALGCLVLCFGIGVYCVLHLRIYLSLLFCAGV